MRAARRPPARPARDTVGGRSAGMQTRRPMPARLSVCGRARRGQAHNGELGYGASGKKSSANPDKCSALEGVRVHQVLPRAPAAAAQDHSGRARAPGGDMAGGWRTWRRCARRWRSAWATACSWPTRSMRAVKAAEVFTPAVLEEEAPAAPEPAAGKGAHGPRAPGRAAGSEQHMRADGPEPGSRVPSCLKRPARAGAAAKGKGAARGGKRKADAQPAKAKKAR